MRKNLRRPWTSAEHSLLWRMHADGATVAEMATAVDRTAGAVEFRLNKMGLSKAGRTGRGPQNRVPPAARTRQEIPWPIRELAMSRPWRLC